MTAVTGVGIAMPGITAPADLLGPRPVDAAPVDPAARLGRKGLRYKDRATHLGLCAAKDALTDAGLLGPDGLSVPGESIGVVVSSNLGNVDTVCRVVATIAEETTRGVSAMDTPNASSNVIASEIAIRFGLRGPNLMVCNGPTSGVDAIRWAVSLLAADRAEHVLVVGVEPDNAEVRALLGTDRVVDGGAALVLTRAAARRHADIGTPVRAADQAACLARLAAEPEMVLGAVPDHVLPGVPRHDLSAVWGETSGALGVLQVAAALGVGGTVLALSGVDGDDAAAGLLVEALR
ncbi:beta-ketoacyl synthase N-terminal-like domain-containing protein [Actinokineospora sp. 24-640]